MLKLSEVCKTVGVTRRTLQEYNKIGLLKPTQISENGYWYYDDTAVAQLQNILIFIEAGYERKQIKNIFELEKSDVVDEYQKAINLRRQHAG